MNIAIANRGRLNGCARTPIAHIAVGAVNVRSLLLGEFDGLVRNTDSLDFHVDLGLYQFGCYLAVCGVAEQGGLTPC